MFDAVIAQVGGQNHAVLIEVGFVEFYAAHIKAIHETSVEGAATARDGVEQANPLTRRCPLVRRPRASQA